MKKLVTNLAFLMLLIFASNVVFAQNVFNLNIPESNKLNVKTKLMTPESGEILYEQLENISTEGGVASQFFPDFPDYSCQGADDFYVPAGEPWIVESAYVLGAYSIEPPGGPVGVANVFFYEDDLNKPGFEIFSFLEFPVTADPDGNFEIVFPEPLVFIEGHYWFSVQPVMPYDPLGQWYWMKQAAPTIYEEFHWQNPGGGFGLPGTETWATASSIEWVGMPGLYDWNLSFALYGTGGGPSLEINTLSTFEPFPAENVRIYGDGFGEFGDGSAIEIDGVLYPEIITYWSDDKIFFDFPYFPGLPVASLRVVKNFTEFSNPVEVLPYFPTEVYFLTPNEDDVISDDNLFISVAAEIYQDLILTAEFQYQLEGSAEWIDIGIDTDGTAKHYSTTGSIGTGDGWAYLWDVSGFTEEIGVTLRAILTDIFGQVLTGERTIVIDKTPLAPFIDLNGSKLNGGIAIDNDSIVFDLEVTDETTNGVEFKWQPPPAPPPGWWNYERELDSIDQNSVTFLDKKGDTVSSYACGPCAMASCLKWLANKYPNSSIGKMSTDSLAKIIADKAGTDSTGTSDQNLEQAAEDLLNGDSGINDDFDVDRHYNNPGSKGGDSHNVNNDIASGLSDSADVVMMIYQKTESGDTIGHFVTASSYHSTISYHHTDEYCVACQTSYVDFMDPATGERVDKIINWYENPPGIQDYDLDTTSSGNAWVEGVITIKPKNGNKSNHPKDDLLIASFPVNGAGNYQFSLACSSLPVGNNLIGAFGVNGQREESGTSYIVCVNGQYELVPYFTADPTVCITGYDINFTDKTSPTDSANWWSWDFGDGAKGSSFEQNPSYAYPDTGTFDVRLIVSDGTNFDTIIREDYIQIVPAEVQQLTVWSGWSGISGYVIPFDDDIVNVMSTVVDELVIIQNFSGYYWPSQGDNTLGIWDYHSGFQVKFENDVIFEIRGMEEAERTLPMTNGWNLMPVLTSCLFETQEIQNQLGDNLTVIKEIAGTKVFWPSQFITTLNRIIPGEGYLILLSADDILEFPECTKSSCFPLFAKEKHLENPWNTVAYTQISHSVSIPNFVVSGFRQGDIIGAFTENNLCAGVTVLEKMQENCALTLFGDDPTTAFIDGFTESEKITFGLFRPSTMKEYQLIAEFDQQMPSSEYYEINGLSALSKLSFKEMNNVSEITKTISIYPNPSYGIFVISGIPSGAEVEIMNLTGAKIVNVVVGDNGILNLQNFNKGIYLIRIYSENITVYDKIVIK